MKILTIVGTRPEFIRLSIIIRKLDKLLGKNHILVHTGQNHDKSLNDVFFQELGIRKPDYYLGAVGTFADELAIISDKLEDVLLKEKPDKFLVLGDTNSSLGAIIAKRLHIPVFHMEAGNRCFDPTSPEEINRKIIDHTTFIHLPYTGRSRFNLLQEGIHPIKIFVTGNPITEVLEYYKKQIDTSQALQRLKLEPKKYFLVTLHREENVDYPKRLQNFYQTFETLTKQYNFPLIWSAHPRTIKNLRLNNFNSEKTIVSEKSVRLVEPFSFFEFAKLQKNAFCVLTDSGTVQEECAILNLPCITLRDSTERPETLESGHNIVVGNNPETIIDAIKISQELVDNRPPPIEYQVKNISDKVIKILFSYHLR